MPIRYQAIILANDRLVYLCIYASPSLSELNPEECIQCILVTMLLIFENVFYVIDFTLARGNELYP